MKVGIIGGGQLAQMLAEAGRRLGMTFQFICPDEQACAKSHGTLICSNYTDSGAYDELLAWADVITYEFEQIPYSVMESLEQKIKLYPSALALKMSSDRLFEKRMFNDLGIETAQFLPVNSLEDLEKAVEVIGRPSILKTRTQGYDGKGQVVVRDTSDLSSVWNTLNQVPCILESMIDFENEYSIIAACNQRGEVVFYPLTENHHREGILRLSLCLNESPLQSQAEALVTKVIRELNYVGVITLEMFQVGSSLIANEIAPRVHNSGHWTQDGANVCQFENHLRAVCDLPLVPPELSAPSAMVNLIGQTPSKHHLETLGPICHHIYGKASRPGRKLGHINITQEKITQAAFQHILKKLLSLVGESELATIIS